MYIIYRSDFLLAYNLLMHTDSLAHDIYGHVQFIDRTFLIFSLSFMIEKNP